eukprot:tig00001181_g7432.t1
MEAGHPAPPYGASGTSERLIITSVFQHHRLRSMPSMPSTPAERARGSPAPSIERARGSLGDEDFARLKAQELEDSDDDVEIDELPPFVRRLFQEAGTQRHVPVALLRDICSSMFPSAAPEQLEELLRSLDSNRDGLVERRDFVRAFNISPSPLKPRTGPATPASFAPSPGPSTPGASPAPLAGARLLAGHAYEGGATPAASARSIAATAPRLHLRDAAAGRAPWDPAANRPERRASMPPAPRPPSAKPPHAPPPGEQAAVAVGAGHAADEAERAAALREALRQVAAEARGAAEAAARAERAAEAAGREAEAVRETLSWEVAWAVREARDARLAVQSTQREVLELNAGYANLGDLLARQAAADRRTAAAAGPAPDARALVHRVPLLEREVARLAALLAARPPRPRPARTAPRTPGLSGPPRHAPRAGERGGAARGPAPLPARRLPLPVRPAASARPEPRVNDAGQPHEGWRAPPDEAEAAPPATPPRPGPAPPAAPPPVATPLHAPWSTPPPPPPGRLEPPATTTGPAKKKICSDSGSAGP